MNGKWTIDARIGSGGMATVYAATHRNGHRAALKMLHTQLSRDESTRARFLREGYVANAVGHPGVAHVEDDGVTEDGCAFLVLELLEGETIEARRARTGGMMPLEEALDIADAALDVLAAAHEKGIVHRDVKPENVFITWDSQVKLLDFGLARMKAVQAEATKTGVTIGTPEFMAPEQAQGKRDEVDALSDIWALGATLFTAITGKNVHDAVNLHEQLIASATKRPRSIRAVLPAVPPAIAIVIDRALELEKKDRWEGAREMQRALRAARAPRTESDRYVSESLTMPAASPASLRRGAPRIPESGPRPSGLGLPSSAPTLQYVTAGPQSDPTIEEPAPVTIHLEDLPLSSGGPMSPMPTTERLTGTGARGSGALLQAASQHAQAIAEALAAQPLASKQATQQMIAAPRPVIPGRHEATLASPGGPIGPGPAPAQPTLASNLGSGAYASLASGTHPAPHASSGAYPPFDGSLDRQTGSGLTNRPGSGPPPPPAPHTPRGHAEAAPSAVAGPVSLRVRRSSRRVVIVSLLLILVCAGLGAWLLQHHALPWHR
ncbi:MAG TPA: protein kinase [Labilithrix sp.]|nr:protein kinase [Labilithrix sp.]